MEKPSLTRLSLSSHPFCEIAIVNHFEPFIYKKQYFSLSTYHLDPPRFRILPDVLQVPSPIYVLEKCK